MKKFIALILLSILLIFILSSCTSKSNDNNLDSNKEVNIEEENLKKENLSDEEIIFNNPIDYINEFELIMKAVSETWGGNELNEKTQNLLEENQVVLDIFETSIKRKLGNEAMLDRLNKALQDVYINNEEKGEEIVRFFDFNDNIEIKRKYDVEDTRLWIPVLDGTYEKNPTYIIGSNKEQVKKLLQDKNYKLDPDYTNNVNKKAIEFQKDNLTMLVYFNDNENAEGVYIESYDGDTITGEGSYVSLNYDELILLASKDMDIEVTNDLIEYNDLGNLEYPTLIIIGKVPENE